jgi:NADH-quinone oxidoreductase subunit E
MSGEGAFLSAEARERIATRRERFPDARSAILFALYVAQRECGGWLPPGVLEEVADAMEVPLAHVASVASFYTMLNRQPVGQHLLQVCTNVSCSLLGAQHIVRYLSDKLGIGVGETTPDGRFTLLEVECLGSCGTAPMMQVDDAYHENLTEGTIDRLLEELAAS